jgi:PAS domain S-box-containing protein
MRVDDLAEVSLGESPFMAATRNSPQKSKNPINIRQHLRWLISIGTCGLLIFAGVASTALLQIRVNSPLYKTISLSNNLIADYVPPYESLLEPDLLCAKLVDAPDQRSRLLYEQDLKAFQREYDLKYAEYMTRVPEGQLKDMMRGEAHETALAYFKLADQLVVLVNGNRMDEARTLLASTMNPLYDRHAAAVDQIVIRAKQEARAAEDRAASSVRIYTAAMVTIGLLILFLEGALSWFLARGISAQTDSLAKSEESLRDSEELYRSTFDQAAVGILHVSFEGQILRCNARYAEIVGYPIEEIPGSNIQRFTPPEFRTATVEAFQQLVTAEISRSGLEKPYLRKDGQVVWARITVSLLRDAQGKPQFAVSMVQDVTERRKAVEALHESEAQLREAEHIAGIGSSVWDVDTDTTTWSPELYRITGLDPSQPPPKHADRARIYTPDSWMRLNSAVEQALAARKPYDLEVEFVRVDGTVCWGHARGTPVCDDNGRVIRLSGTLQDITDQKRAQEALLRLR